MKNNNKTHFGDTSLGVGISIALIILAVCLGVGGCTYLGDLK
jgi:hypothetical protein